MEHESDIYTNCNWCSWYSYQRTGTRTGGLGNRRTSGNHPKYCIIEIGQNTEKSSGDLKRLAITQTPVRNHQVSLMRKPLRWVKYLEWKIDTQILLKSWKKRTEYEGDDDIVVWALGAYVWKRDLGKLAIKGRMKTIQTTSPLKLSRILRRVLETGVDLLSLRFQWKKNTHVKKSPAVK